MTRAKSKNAGTRAAKRRAKSGGNGPSKPPRNLRAQLDEIHGRLAQPAWQKRIAWLRRPRLHTAKFEEVVQDEEMISQGCAIFRLDDPEQGTHEVARKLGWCDYRLDVFTQVVVAYRRNPTIENYVHVRKLFPEVEIQVAQFGGVDSLFALESEFRKQGIDPELVAAALDADEPSIDALCLHLLECLIARGNLPKDGPGHIEKRRNAITVSTVNYLIVEMLEALDYHEETFRVPASLVVLIRHQLCGLKPDLHEEVLSRQKQENAALTARHRLQPGERLSINKLVKMTGIPRSTAARWLADKKFQRFLESSRRLAVEGLFKAPPRP